MRFNLEKNIKELTGKKFGRLTLIQYIGRSEKDGKHMWLCRCECGNETIALENSMKIGKKRSCGCISRENVIKRNTRHGLRRDQLYRVWANMRQRCNNKNHRDYHRYGGRGITISEEWNSPEMFIKWGYKNGFKEGLTLDRINNDGNYTHDNCRFVTMSVQCRNKSTNTKVEYKGKFITIAELAEETKISYCALNQRFHNGDRDERLIRPLRVDCHATSEVSYGL